MPEALRSWPRREPPGPLPDLHALSALARGIVSLTEPPEARPGWAIFRDSLLQHIDRLLRSALQDQNLAQLVGDLGAPLGGERIAQVGLGVADVAGLHFPARIAKQAISAH